MERCANMLPRIKSFIHRRLPRLASWLHQIRSAYSQRTRVRIPDIDNQIYERRRLLIDVTQTSTVDFLSGIQRVVLRIAQELVASGDELVFEPVLVRLEQSGGKLQLVRAVELEARVGSKDAAPYSAIRIRQRDILLMLDSSWSEYAFFEKGVFPTLKSEGGMVISCLYDLIPITNPEFFVKSLALSFSRWLPLVLRSSDAVLCISKATKDSLEKHLANCGERFEGTIDYFHLGADFVTQVKPKQKQNDDVPTVLMVGTLEPRKGYGVAFAAFQSLWTRGERIRLHIIGRFGWSVESLVAEMTSSAAFGNNLIIEIAGSDDVLQQAYGNADLVLSASFAEGFGLPLVEAAALGKCLMVSDIPAYREVCGKDAIYFKSGNPEDLADKLEDWLRNRPALPPPKFITWSESSRQLIDRISSLASQTNVPNG